MCDLQKCDICGGDKPADMVNRTTLPSIDPIEVDVCRVCEIVQKYEHPDDVCRKCGDDIGTGFSIEIEYPLGTGEFPARLSGSLCADCAGWIGHNITYHSIESDEEACDEWVDVIREQRRRLSELEAQEGNDGLE